MSDEELRELFSAYIDGQVSVEVREQIEHRVADDSDLRDELESLRALVTELSSLPVEDAPEGFTARVMDEVEGLDIPSQGARTATSESSFDQNLESLSVPLWLKGSIAASLAATVALGFFVLRAPLDHRSQGDSSSDLLVAEMDSWSAPMGTGVDGLAEATGEPSQEDGVVALDLADKEAHEPGWDGATAKQSVRSEESAGAVVNEPMQRHRRRSLRKKSPALVTQSGKKRRAKSGLKEVSADRAFPEGVYEADHEEAKPATALAEVEAESVIEEVLSADGVAEADEDRFDSAEVENLEIRVGTPPPIDPMRRGGLARRSSAASPMSESTEATDSTSSLADEGAGAASGFAGQDGALDAPSELAVVSEEKGEDGGDMPSIAAKVAIGTLRVASPGVIATMSSEIVSRSWSVQNLTPMSQNQVPAVGSQLLQITVPEGDEEAVSSLLSSYGALNLDRVLAAAHDGNARLRLTVRWGN